MGQEIEAKHEGEEGGNQVIWGENVPGRANSSCKSPEVRLFHKENCSQVSTGRAGGGEGTEVTGQIVPGLTCCGRTWGFTSEVGAMEGS